MRKAILPIACLIVVGTLLLNSSRDSSAATVTHLVISEVRVAGVTAGDEFVELYNPTDVPVSLAGWRLRNASSTGTESNLVASLSGSIAPHGFFLVGSPSYSGSVLPDVTYSATSNAIAINGGVVLYSDASITLIDKVGFGTGVASESATTTPPPASGSSERKANSASTLSTMTTGADQFAGNGEDTDNNANDFVTRTVSGPQNSASAIEPVLPTITPVLTPTNTPTPTPTPLPTSTPTPSPISRFRVVCVRTSKMIVTPLFTIRLPLVKCSLVKS